MGYFADDQDVYDHVGKLITDVLADEELGPRFCSADTVVRYEHTDPQATITVVLRDPAAPAGDLRAERR